MRHKNNSFAIVAALALVLVLGIIFIRNTGSGSDGDKETSSSSSQTEAQEVQPQSTIPLPTIAPPSSDTGMPQNAGTSASSFIEAPPQDTAANAYILPHSASVPLTEADLVGLSEKDLKRARNEIFARHGRRFDDPELQRYFDAQPWYKGTIDPKDFDPKSLSVLEDENAKVIRAYEHKMGYNGQ